MCNYFEITINFGELESPGLPCVHPSLGEYWKKWSKYGVPTLSYNVKVNSMNMLVRMMPISTLFLSICRNFSTPFFHPQYFVFLCYIIIIFVIRFYIMSDDSHSYALATRNGPDSHTKWIFWHQTSQFSFETYLNCFIRCSKWQRSEICSSKTESFQCSNWVGKCHEKL